MTTNFPTSLDDHSILPNAKANSTVTINDHAPLHNNVSDAVIAIETALGIHPYGSYSTVAAAILNKVDLSPATAQTIAPTADVVAITVKQGNSAYTSHLEDWKNSGGTVLAYVDSTGIFSAQGLDVAGVPFSATPSGVILPYGAATAPSSAWLLCDGTSYLRATYPALFTAIGTTFGSVDGTHFNVPDMHGRMPVGYASGGHADVATLGASDGSTLANRRPKHLHTVTDPGHGHVVDRDTHSLTPGTTPYTFGPIGPTTDVSTASATTAITVGVASAAPTDTPAYLVLNYIIKT